MLDPCLYLMVSDQVSFFVNHNTRYIYIGDICIGDTRLSPTYVANIDVAMQYFM